MNKAIRNAYGRRRLIIVALLFIFFLAFALVSCRDDEPKKLSAPENIRVEHRVLYWDEVKNADYYVVSISTKEKYETTECQFPLYDLRKTDNYNIKVFAKSNDDKYEVSSGGEISVTLVAPVEEGTDEYGFQYAWVEELKGYEVSKGNAGKRKTLVIPDYFQGYPVKKIANYGFEWNNTPTPQNGVNQSWWNELKDNKVTTEIRFPKHLESIGHGAFSYTIKLEEVTIPETVTSIGSWAFSNCISLKKVTFSNGLKEIGFEAFYNTALEAIDLPDTLEVIGNRAFKCDKESLGVSLISAKLTRVVIPNSVKEMGKNIFVGRKGLTEIVYQGVAYTYSVAEPMKEGNFWRYDEDGYFTIWE